MRLQRLDIVVGEDPTEKVLGVIGDSLEGCPVLGSDVLVWHYTQPERTRGGIIRADSTKKEDIYQGKVGMILAMGPDAFRWFEKDGSPYEGRVPQLHEWVVFRTSDSFDVGWMPDTNDSSHWLLRYVPDTSIKQIVSRPDLIW